MISYEDAAVKAIEMILDEQGPHVRMITVDRGDDAWYFSGWPITTSGEVFTAQRTVRVKFDTGDADWFNICDPTIPKEFHDSLTFVEMIK